MGWGGGAWIIEEKQGEDGNEDREWDEERGEMKRAKRQGLQRS